MRPIFLVEYIPFFRVILDTWLSIWRMRYALSEELLVSAPKGCHMLAMGIAHRKGERSQALKGCNTIPFGIMEFMVRSAGSYFPHEKLLDEYQVLDAFRRNGLKDTADYLHALLWFPFCLFQTFPKNRRHRKFYNLTKFLLIFFSPLLHKKFLIKFSLFFLT